MTEPAVTVVPPDERRPRRSRWVVWPVVIAVVAVVAAAGAGFAAGSLVGGGGTQPEDVLPATTVAFADIDLDPAAEQKVNIVRLLGRLPDVADRYGDEPDLPELIVSTFLDGGDLDQARVQDWVGDRFGAGLVWDEASRSLTPVVAIQAADQDAAVADLTAAAGEDSVATVGDYVIVTGPDALGDGTGVFGGTASSQTADEVAAAAAQGSLGETEEFQSAFDHLDDGVASFYVDGTGLAAAADQVGPAGLDLGSVGGRATTGQSAAVLRAEPDAIEVVGWSSTELPESATTASLAAGLPADTAAALEITGGASLVRSPRDVLGSGLTQQGLDARDLDRLLAQIESQLGIALPDDLQTLLGSDAVVAVAGDALVTGIPGIGIRSMTDPAAGADLADRLQTGLALLTGGFGLVAEGTDDGMVLATSQDYADALAAGDGGLGASSAFRRALPDAEDASYLVWIDLGALSGPIALTDPDAADAIAPLDSLGVTVGSDGDGTGLRARLVFSEESS